MSTLADRLFDATLVLDKAETALHEEVSRILGGVEMSDWCDDLTWDYYDRSLEAKGCKPGTDLTDDQMAAIHAIGFTQCWLNYDDGTERHYWLKDGEHARGEVRTRR